MQRDGFFFVQGRYKGGPWGVLSHNLEKKILCKFPMGLRGEDGMGG